MNQVSSRVVNGGLDSEALKHTFFNSQCTKYLKVLISQIETNSGDFASQGRQI